MLISVKKIFLYLFLMFLRVALKDQIALFDESLELYQMASKSGNF